MPNNNCKRCNSYATRLDQLNKNFNTLWDFLISKGYDPEKVLESRSE